MVHITAKKYDKITNQSKYRNKHVYVYEDNFISNTKTSGHGKITEHFDSKKEYTRCRELELLQKNGKISDLKRQVPLMILPAFTDSSGEKQRAITYKADFIYIENGKEIVEDVKGFSKGKYRCTETFKLKWKLLKAKYPEKIFRLY